jgi:hypothetical protein
MNIEPCPPHREDDDDLYPEGYPEDDEICPECGGSGNHEDDGETCFGCGGWGYSPDPDADEQRRKDTP